MSLDHNHFRYTSSPWGFRETPFAEQCRWAAQHGMKDWCGQFYSSPGLFSIERVKEEAPGILRNMKENGLRFASFNAGGDFSVKSGIEAQIATARLHIEQAAQFRPEVIIVFAGWEKREDEAVYQQVSKALSEVALFAAGFNMKVALENHGGLTTTAEQINRILDGADEPNLGVNYDPANFLMYGEDPLQELLSLHHPIHFTHFKSLKHVDGKKTYCRLSEGEIDYAPILKHLGSFYKGFYAIEYEETSDVFQGSEDDLAALKKWMGKKQIAEGVQK